MFGTQLLETTGYDVNVVTGQTGTLNGTTFSLDNLNPGETVTVEVTAESGNSCSDVTTTFTCVTESCEPIDVIIDPVADICLTASTTPIQLEVEITGGMNGDTTWTGTGMIDTIPGLFDPIEADTGLHEIIVEYSEGVCIYRDTISIAVFYTPTADFTVGQSPICLGDLTTITYTGTADTSATYSWSFNGGTATPGTGAGPHDVSWNSGVDKTITLVVEENGCSSEVFSSTVTVETVLPTPTISCGTSTTTSVEFTWVDIPNAEGYTVNVLTGQSGTQNNNTFTVDNLAPGEEVTIEVIALDSGPCGNTMSQASCFADNCPTFTFNIDPVSDICLDGANSTVDLMATVSGGDGNGTSTWSGNGVIDTDNGIFDPADAGPGMHTITLTYTEGPCTDDASIVINVFDTPTSDFTVSNNLLCTDELTTIMYTGTASAGANYTWSFNGGMATPGTGQGPHMVSWDSPGSKTITLTVEENNCTSIVFSETVTVESPMADPVINCGTTTTTSVEFTWADVTDAEGYTVNVITGQSGTQNNNTFTVDNLLPGETVTIEVVALNSGPCGNTMSQATCSADDCPTFTINIDPVADICLDASTGTIDLSASIAGGAGNGVESWSGTGIIDADNGIFDPTDAGAGTHTVTLTYTEGPCVGSSNIDITVFDTPTADFSISTDPVCINESTIITYDGTATAGATYTWNFNGGSATPGTGQGPHTVNWASGGTKTITLIVEENNCTSVQFSATVEVETPLAEPVINCNPTTSSIEFTWNDVPGAVSYNVTVTAGPSGTQNGNSYLIDGLTPGTSVTIEVEAVGTGPCGNSTATETCVAEDCPTVTIDFDPVAPICLDATAVPVTLNANLTGNTSGTENWTGPGITDNDLGIFDPTIAGPGEHTINYTYQEGNCSYNNSLPITIFAQPTADFTVDDLICLDQSSSVVYTGTASNSATYDWDFDGGTANPGTGVGPHEVSWIDGGLKTITLTVTENGCPSEEFTQTVQVDIPLADPVISCTTT